MKVIHKFTIDSQLLTLDIPKEAEILAVQEQHGSGQIWILLDPEAPTISRSFVIAMTGQPLGDTAVGKNNYIDTFQLKTKGLVLHLFEVTP